MEDGVDETKARNNVTAAIQNHPDVNILAGIWSYNAPAIADVVRLQRPPQGFHHRHVRCRARMPS